MTSLQRRSRGFPRVFSTQSYVISHKKRGLSAELPAGVRRRTKSVLSRNDDRLITGAKSTSILETLTLQLM